MNYFERHLGDYARDAGHLSMLEHGAYTLLLDRYYTTEQGIPADTAHRICRARTRDERAAVDAVLAEFFTLTNGVWVNGRAEREITKMRAKVEAARTNGKKGGRPKANPKLTQQKPTGLAVGSIPLTQQKAHQTPDTSYSEPNGSGAEAPPASPPPSDRDLVFANGVAQLTAAGITDRNARSFLAAQCKAHGERAVRLALDRCAAERPIQPIPWLQADLAKLGGGAKGRHTGFETMNYREGITADGSLT